MCSWFPNDSVNSSKCMASNDRMNKSIIMTIKDMEQIFCRLTSALIMQFAQWNAGKGHNTSVRTKIQTWTS